MTRKALQAKRRRGYNGPLFFPGSERLHSVVYDAELEQNRVVTIEFLEALGKKMGCLVSVTIGNKTSDNYVWFCSVNFRFENEEVSILFPNGKGAGADRHLAVYTRNSENLNLAEKIITEFLLFFTK